MALIKKFFTQEKRVFQVLLVFVVILNSTNLQAQLEVTNSAPITPENLISNVFLGDGVEVISITFEGDNRAVGLFTNGENDIGISRGIVMTTGRAVTLGGGVGVDASGTTDASEATNSSADDPDLASLVSAGFSINDVCKYTIEFIPTNDTLQFTYSFASEEYPDYVCSDFNDVFGFFISGPGINGTLQNGGENIALIPGTSRPVTINNVNSGQVGLAGTVQNCAGAAGSLAFSQFYNSNQTASFPVYNGYTDVFVAQAIVMPCSLYTIKLVIADASDQQLDSGVFLEAKSFGTGSLDVEITGLAVDGGLAEGCSEGEIVFSFPSPVESDYDVQLGIGGTATPGVDYPTLPSNIIIPAGEHTFTINLSAIDDGIVEGDEFIELSVQRDPCHRDTFLIVIKDNILLDPDLGSDFITCPTDDTPLDGTVSVPLPEPPRFENNMPLEINATNTTFVSEIEVTGVLPLVLDESAILSICIDSLEHRWIDDLDIFIVTPGGQFLELTTDNGRDGGNGVGFDYYIGTCFTVNATVPINFPGPDALPESLPLTGNWLPEGVWSDLWDGDNPTNGTWQLIITDDSNGLNGTLFSWSITFNAAYQIEYSWSPMDGLSCSNCPGPIASPDGTTTYIMTATDSYGCQTEDSIHFEVLPVLTMSEVVCSTNTSSSVAILWPEVIGANSYEVSVNGGAWLPSNDVLSHTVTGLGILENVEMRVRAVGECPGFFSVVNCTTLDCTPASFSVNPTHVSCFEGIDGGGQINIDSGTGPFSYELGAEMNNTGLFINLEAGIYTAEVTDGLACTGRISFIVNEPPFPDFNPVVEQIINCNGANNGALTIDINNGNGPFTFNWNNASMDSIATGLIAGNYTLGLTDAANCSYNVNLTIDEPSLLETTITANDALCAGANDGQAWAIVNGGTLPYSYLWDNGQILDTAFLLTANTYTITITDVNNCTLESMIVVNEPISLTATTSSQEQACFGLANGQAGILPSGGTMPYFYEWNNGQNTATITALTTGDYSVTVTDSQSCTYEETVNVGVVEAVSIASFDITNVSCTGGNDGQVDVELTGGMVPFTWSDPLTNLLAGSYSFTVTDANNCTDIIVVEIQEPALLSLNAAITNASCLGEQNGAINLSVLGGAAPYSYAWSTGSIDEDVFNLEAEVYTVSVTDANNCLAILENTVSEATQLSITTDFVDVDCFGAANGSIVVQGSGGAVPYAFVWSNTSTMNQQSNLTAGDYSMTMTDAFGCEKIETLSINQPEEVVATLLVTDISCFGKRNGMVKIDAIGGTPPYRFRHSGSNSWQTNASFIGLFASDYSFELEDEKGCLQTLGTVSILEPPLIEIDLGGNRDLLFGETINIFPIITAANPIELYQWLNFDSTWMECEFCLEQTIFPEYQQDLFLYVEDERGCSAEEWIRIRVEKDFPVQVATGFTPNGDNINDLLMVHGLPGSTILSFQVWDRWGELVYTQNGFDINDTQIGWDGSFRNQAMNSGVYLWKIEVLLPDGKTRLMAGQTTLIR